MGKITNLKNSFKSDSQSFLEDTMNFIDTSLRNIGVNKKLIQKTELITEEIIPLLVKNAPSGEVLVVQIKRYFGDATVALSMKGEEFSLYSDDEALSEDASQSVIRSVLLRSFGENFKYINKKHVNRIRIVAGQSEQKVNNSALYALVLGIVLGALAKFLLPQTVNDSLCLYLLDPIKTLFMNAIRIIIAPVVFFSIVACFSQFDSLAEIGKLGAKVIRMYLLTTVIAVSLGILMFYLIKPGEYGFALSSNLSAESVNINTDVDTSILSTLINIVPSNFLSPFLESDTLQLIFLAMLCGISVGSIGKYSSMLKELFDALNTLFLSITTMIAKFIPFAAFVSVATLVMKMSSGSLLSIVGVVLTHALTIFIMIGIYCLLILVMGRLNPIKFLSKSKEGMLTSFSLSSSSAALPTNLRVCIEKLGVSPLVANFSLPLGATINMDGTCIFLSVIGLFLARAYGIDVSVPTLISLSITIILLSLGAPGVPGSALICLGVVLESLGIPIEALGLIIAVNPIIDMLDTMNNTTGDLTAAVIVAKNEGFIDLDKFNS